MTLISHSVSHQQLPSFGRLPCAYHSPTRTAPPHREPHQNAQSPKIQTPISLVREPGTSRYNPPRRDLFLSDFTLAVDPFCAGSTSSTSQGGFTSRQLRFRTNHETHSSFGARACAHPDSVRLGLEEEAMLFFLSSLLASPRSFVPY